MAKRTKKAPEKRNEKKVVPDDIEWVEIKVPVYRGPVSRSMPMRIDARLQNRDQMDAANRIYTALYKLNSDISNHVSIGNVLTKILQLVSDAEKK